MSGAAPDPDPPQLESMLEDAGLRVVRHYESDAHKFSLVLAEPD